MLPLFSSHKNSSKQSLRLQSYLKRVTCSVWSLQSKCGICKTHNFCDFNAMYVTFAWLATTHSRSRWKRNSKIGIRRYSMIYTTFRTNEVSWAWKAPKRKYGGKICLSEIDKLHSGSRQIDISPVEKINTRLLYATVTIVMITASVQWALGSPRKLVQSAMHN